MMEARGMRGSGRNHRVGRALHATAHLIVSALLVLGCLSTSWRENPFLDALRFPVRFRDRVFDVPAVLLLPFVVPILWSIGVVLRHSWREVSLDLRERWWLVFPIFGFGALSLIRVYPIHIPLKARIAWMDVLIFWFVFLYTWVALPPRWTWSAFGLLLIVQGAVAVVQFAVQGPVGVPVLNEVAPYPADAGASVIEVSGRRWLRAYGLTPHPNVLGGYLSMMLCLVAGAWLAAPRSRRWLIAALVLGSAGAFVSFSRSAWLGLAVGIVYAGGLLRPRHVLSSLTTAQRRRWTWSAAALGTGVVVFGLAFRELLIARFLRLGTPLESASIRERIRDARQAWMLIRNRPLCGVGTGTYVEALWAWAKATGRQVPGFQHVHNVPLLAASEIGIGGALLWLWLVTAPPLDGWLQVRGPRAVGPMRVGVGAAFIVAFVVSMTDYYLYVPTTLWSALYLGVFGGLAARVSLDGGR